MKTHKTKAVSIKLGKAEVHAVYSAFGTADALADVIKTQGDFEIVTASAEPIQALSDPKVQEEVKQADLVWAFNSETNTSSLIGGEEVLAYGILWGFSRPLTMMGFRYDPRRDSFELLAETVKALRLAYRRENHIIKTFSDDFPPLALSVRDIIDPKVREKVAQADLLTVVEKPNLTKNHTFLSKKASEVADGNDQRKKSKLKFMTFYLDPEMDSLERFVAEVTQVKGANWQN